MNPDYSKMHTNKSHSKGSASSAILISSVRDRKGRPSLPLPLHLLDVHKCIFGWKYNNHSAGPISLTFSFVAELWVRNVHCRDVCAPQPGVQHLVWVWVWFHYKALNHNFILPLVRPPSRWILCLADVVKMISAKSRTAMHHQHTSCALGLKLKHVSAIVQISATFI